MAIASVSLLEAIQLELGMQLFEEAHGGYGSTVSMRIGNVQESTNVSRRDRKQCGSEDSLCSRSGLTASTIEGKRTL